MAQFNFKVVTLRELDQQRPYACRYQFECEPLKRSIAERGVIQPILVTEAWGSMTVVAGHKRVYASLALGIEKIGALVIEGDLSSHDLFLISVLSNWQQQMTDMDIAFTISQAARRFNLSEVEILEQVMPALGVKPEKPLIQECCDLFELHPAVIECLAEERIPFRGAKALSRLSSVDQQVFAEQITAHAQFSTNQLMQLCDWLGDLLQKKKMTLAQFLNVEGVRDVLTLGQPDRRRKAETFVRLIRSYRFPELSEKENQFQSKQRHLKEQFDNVAFEVPSYFEDEGFHLRIHARNQESLQETLTHLKDKKKLLNSLFDIML